MFALVIRLLQFSTVFPKQSHSRALPRFYQKSLSKLIAMMGSECRNSHSKPIIKRRRSRMPAAPSMPPSLTLQLLQARLFLSFTFVSQTHHHDRSAS